MIFFFLFFFGGRGQIWCVLSLSEELSFETFTPIWSHVSEKKNICQKSNILNSQLFEQLW